MNIPSRGVCSILARPGLGGSWQSQELRKLKSEGGSDALIEERREELLRLKDEFIWLSNKKNTPSRRNPGAFLVDPPPPPPPKAESAQAWISLPVKEDMLLAQGTGPSLFDLKATIAAKVGPALLD